MTKLPQGILRGVAMQSSAHTLSPRAPAIREREREHEQDEALQLAFERGLEEGFAQAMERARKETEETIALRVEEGVDKALATLRAQALEAGRNEGLAEAQRALDEERLIAAQRVELVLADIARQTRTWVRAVEDEVVLLAHDAACRIVAKAAVEPEAVRVLVQELVDELCAEGSDVLHVHVHPDDCVAFATGAETGWRWVPDESLKPGGVFLRSPRGGFDARLESQVAAMSRLLEEARARRDSELQ